MHMQPPLLEVWLWGILKNLGVEYPLRGNNSLIEREIKRSRSGGYQLRCRRGEGVCTSTGLLGFSRLVSVIFRIKHRLTDNRLRRSLKAQLHTERQS